MANSASATRSLSSAPIVTTVPANLKDARDVGNDAVDAPLHLAEDHDASERGPGGRTRGCNRDGGPTRAGARAGSRAVTRTDGHGDLIQQRDDDYGTVSTCNSATRMRLCPHHSNQVPVRGRDDSDHSRATSILMSENTSEILPTNSCKMVRSCCEHSANRCH
jgi:hypothetical protein